MNAPSNYSQDSHQKSDRSRALICIFLFALLLRIINLITLSHSPFFEFKIGDAARYDAWAHEIAAGNWIGDEVFYQAPLYPYFLATIYATIGDGVFLVKAIQALMAALACVLVAAAAWNLFNRRAGIAAGVIMACYVPSMFLETLLQKSILDLFFLALIVWLFSRIVVLNRLREWAFLGIAIGGLCLTRENALALIPLFGIAGFWNWQKSKRHKDQKVNRPMFAAVGYKRLPLFVAGLAVILFPVAMRNYYLGGEFHLTTSQLGPNFYIGNNPNADGYYRPLVYGRGDARFEQSDAVALAEQSAGRELSAGEVSQHYMAESAKFIREEPTAWFTLVGKKAMLSINSTEIVDTEDQYVYELHSPILAVLSPLFQFGLLFPIGMIGIWTARNQWRRLWVLIAMVAIFQLTLVAFFVFGRYRFPAVPILAIFAGPVIAQAWLQFRYWIRHRVTWNPNRNNLSFAGLAKAGVVVFMLVACHWPMIQTRNQASVTYNNFAIQSLIRGRWAEADQFIDRSLHCDPDFPLAHNSKGVLHRESGEVSQAKYHFQVAVELQPGYQTAKENLHKLQH